MSDKKKKNIYNEIQYIIKVLININEKIDKMNIKIISLEDNTEYLKSIIVDIGKKCDFTINNLDVFKNT